MTTGQRIPPLCKTRTIKSFQLKWDVSTIVSLELCTPETDITCDSAFMDPYPALNSATLNVYFEVQRHHLHVKSVPRPRSNALIAVNTNSLSARGWLKDLQVWWISRVIVGCKSEVKGQTPRIRCAVDYLQNTPSSFFHEIKPTVLIRDVTLLSLVLFI